jgi:hypothetical protein
MSVRVTNVPVKIALAMSGLAMTAPAMTGRAKIVLVKIVAAMATAVTGSAIAASVGRSAPSSRGIGMRAIRRRSMTANRCCRRCRPPSRARRAAA